VRSVENKVKDFLALQEKCYFMTPHKIITTSPGNSPTPGFSFFPLENFGSISDKVRLGSDHGSSRDVTRGGSQRSLGINHGLQGSLFIFLEKNEKTIRAPENRIPSSMYSTPLSPSPPSPYLSSLALLSLLYLSLSLFSLPSSSSPSSPSSPLHSFFTPILLGYSSLLLCLLFLFSFSFSFASFSLFLPVGKIGG
jgi:hypothetical protein